MLNIIRADLYRIFRGKGFYITTILLLALIGILVLTGQLYISNESAQTQYSTSGMSIPFQMMAEPAIMIYFILPFMIFICSADFSGGTVKNPLSNGIPRAKFYLSKLILSCVSCFCLFFVYIVISTELATMAYGFGGTFDMSFIANVLRPFMAQLFMFISVVCVTVFLAFATKKTAAVIGLYIVLFLGQIFLFSILASLSDNLLPLLDYEIISITSNLVNIDSMALGDIVRTFAVGGFYILASTIGGIAIFSKSEIK